MEFTKSQLVGFVGAITLLIGVFLPVVSMPIVGSISLLNNGKSDGAVLLGLAITSMILILLNKIRLTLVTGGI